MNMRKDHVAIPSAKETIELLKRNPQYMAKHADREAQRQEFATMSAPILSELAAAGLNYSSTEDLTARGGTAY